MAPAKKENQRKAATTSNTVDTPVAEKPKRAKRGPAMTTDVASKEDPQPKKSRKRAADLQVDDGEPSTSSAAAKPEKPKKKAKTGVGKDVTSSKVDGHPVEIAKTHPGGDSVEVEPTKIPKGKKGKAAKVEKESEVTDEKEVEKPAPVAPKSKKPGKKEQSEDSTAKAKVPTSKTDVVSKPSTRAAVGKSKKSKELQHDEEPAGNAEEATPKAVDEEPPEALVSTADSKKAAPKKDKPRAKPKKGDEQSLATPNEDQPMEDSITVEIPISPKRQKGKQLPETEDTFESVDVKATKPGKATKAKVSKNSKGKDVTEGEMPKKPSKSDLPEEAKESALDEEEPSSAAKPTSRKRKSSIDKDGERPNLIDILAAGEVPTKKPRKSKAESSTPVGKVQDLLNSGLDTAMQGLNTAKDYIGDLANSAQKSIIGDISEVASEAVDLKNKEKKKAAKPPASKKGKGKAKGLENAPQEEGSGTLVADAPGVTDDAEDTIRVADYFSDEDEDDDDDAANEDAEDDQTAALLKGFESSEDEDAFDGEGFTEGQKIPRLPDAAKKASNKLKKASNGETGVGVVYIGRIPHGFYEHQMREYFSQFGTIQRLRLSRNRKTGKSKHYAFIEFASADVAKIVANTMDNYLMFGHILKCKLVPNEEVHENLWKGANKRFKQVPWNKIEGRKLAMGMGREAWEKRVGREEKRRVGKAEKLKEIGYEFDAGKLKGVDSVPIRANLAPIEDAAQDQEIIEQEKTVVVDTGDGGGTIIVSEEVSTKKGEKPGKKVEKLKSDVGNAAGKMTTTANNAGKMIEENFDDTLKQAKEAAEKLKQTAKEGSTANVSDDGLEAGPSTAQPAKGAAKHKAAKKEKVEKAPKEAKPAKKEKVEKAPKEAKPKPAKKEKVEKEPKPAKREKTEKAPKAPKAPPKSAKKESKAAAAAAATT